MDWLIIIVISVVASVGTLTVNRSFRRDKDV